jgi:DNA excision repair protein ERCC-3
MVAEQWRRTFSEHTSLDASEVAINRIGSAVSIVTYHSVARSARRLLGHRWRTVIYDEVQSLPADSFRVAAQIVAPYRLGLTATLVREDGREREIAALIGPPLFEMSWRELERMGWISPARCVEIRIPNATDDASSLRYKLSAIERLLHVHRDKSVLVVGSRLRGLRLAGQHLRFPVVTGEDGPERRSELLEKFRRGEIHTLGMSKIGSVGVDLPEASVLIQMSGTFGSRQEEAQRLGRILRPSSSDSAWFYSIVEAGTREVGDADRRQRFLVEQGYVYETFDAAALPRPERRFRESR